MKENILLIKLNACGKIIQNVMRGLKYALGFACKRKFKVTVTETR